MAQHRKWRLPGRALRMHRDGKATRRQPGGVRLGDGRLGDGTAADIQLIGAVTTAGLSQQVATQDRQVMLQLTPLN